MREYGDVLAVVAAMVAAVATSGAAVQASDDQPSRSRKVVRSHR